MNRNQGLAQRLELLVVSVLVVVGVATGQFRKDIEHDEGCTSITVGRLATTDGSVLVCHTCDGNYRTWVNIVPHQTHPQGSVRQIYWGNLHTETPSDMRGKILKGEVPQVAETFSYLNVAYPCLNEKQLAFGETTIMGREELRNDEGLFLIEELQSIALERCRTAREAIRLMGDLATQYGYGDWGECLTVADTKEVWQFEIFGSGPVDIGAVWAAQRIPDGHVGVSANIPRISQIDVKDTVNFMASANVHSLAEEMGWWDASSGEPFRYWKAYSGKKPYSIREYFILNAFAPSLGLTMEAEELPFTVKPEQKLSVSDIMAMYRQTYEGTEYDVTKNLLVPPSRRPRPGQTSEESDQEVELIKSPVANPFMGRDMIRLFNSIKPGTVKDMRLIAIARCSYSQIIQLRGWLPDEVGGVAWFSFDNPAQSPRIPIFAGALDLPESFGVCGQQKYRTDAAIWWFRRANRLATVAWGRTREAIESSVAEFEAKGFSDLPMIEQKVKAMLKDDGSPDGRTAVRRYLTRYTNDAARAAMVKWWELGDQFWAEFARGF
jgi:dipeptidase